MRTLLIFLLTVCLLLGTDAYGQAVRVIFFSPADQPDLNQQKINKVAGITKKVQDFYRDQQIKNGFDGKVFQLEGDATRVEMHIVRGNRNTAHYAAERWQDIILEIADARSRINLIFVEGLEILSVRRHAVMQRSCLRHACATDDFTYDAIVPFENIGVIPAAAHEFGHAFGLQHNRDNAALMVGVRKIPVGQNPPIETMHLKTHESRWLDRHKFFNSDNIPNDPPTVKKIHPTEWVDPDWIDIRLRIEIESDSELHQAQLVRDTGDVVIGSEALMGRSDNAYFHFSKHLLQAYATSRYNLQIMDRDGNQRYVDGIRIELPEIVERPTIPIAEKRKDDHSVVVLNWASVKIIN